MRGDDGSHGEAEDEGRTRGGEELTPIVFHGKVL